MKNIAIIGAGISGLTSAYLLSQKHKVSIFEKNDKIGGHTATVDVAENKQTLAIDTGFIVFNNRTYPLFLKLLKKIGVEKQETEMSFSVQNTNTGLEYNGHDLNTLFAQRTNLFKPSFWRLIKEILRFNKLATKAYHSNEFGKNSTLAEFLQLHGFSNHFCEHYILPMGAAIWSSSLEEMSQFELQFFLRFFHNHGLLSVNNRPQWYVIPGGSRSYLAPLTEKFKSAIHTKADIEKIKRVNNEQGNIEIRFADGKIMYFDEVVFACHSDQALALLDDANELEQSILNDIPYRKNEVVLHQDTRLLPKSRRAWASWNYQLDNNRQRAASVTYNMNILQGLHNTQTYCVTLNQTQDINKSKIIQSFEYSHPVFNLKSLAAQQRRLEICGQNHSHFTGAYWYNGFHEDGVRSAVDVAKRFECYL